MRADAKDSTPDLTIKDISIASAGAYLTGNVATNNSDLYDLLKEIFDRVQCLQRAIVVMCKGYHDFKAEYAEDIAELKRALQDLRNKVWLAREAV
jgi:hypothetical protein